LIKDIYSKPPDSFQGAFFVEEKGRKGKGERK
jgi:hypothetical protein